MAALCCAGSFLCLSRTSPAMIYPPLLSSRFPLSTPAAFWASALGMRRLGAAVVWMQALQYYGDRDPEEVPPEFQRRPAEGFSLLYPQLKYYWQQVIRIDPLFIEAYLTGPVTLGWNLKRYDEALELIDEGIRTLEETRREVGRKGLIEVTRRHPLITGSGDYIDELLWKLYTLKTVLVYLDDENFPRAQSALEELLDRKDAPEVIKVMLAQIYARNGFYGESLSLWKELYDTTPDMDLRRSAERNIERLRALLYPG